MRLSHPVKLSIEVNWFCPIFNLVISDFIDLEDIIEDFEVEFFEV